MNSEKLRELLIHFLQDADAQDLGDLAAASETAHPDDFDPQGVWTSPGQSAEAYAQHLVDAFVVKWGDRYAQAPTKAMR